MTTALNLSSMAHFSLHIRENAEDPLSKHQTSLCTFSLGKFTQLWFYLPHWQLKSQKLGILNLQFRCLFSELPTLSLLSPVCLHAQHGPCGQDLCIQDLPPLFTVWHQGTFLTLWSLSFPKQHSNCGPIQFLLLTLLSFLLLSSPSTLPLFKLLISQSTLKQLQSLA